MSSYRYVCIRMQQAPYQIFQRVFSSVSEFFLNLSNIEQVKKTIESRSLYIYLWDSLVCSVESIDSFFCSPNLSAKTSSQNFIIQIVSLSYISTSLEWLHVMTTSTPPVNPTVTVSLSNGGRRILSYNMFHSEGLRGDPCGTPAFISYVFDPSFES